MKKHINRYILMLVLLVSGAACTDVIELEVADGETLLAVEGWIYDTPGPYTINLSTTAPYFYNQQTPRATGAVVHIADSEGFSEELVEVAPGKYQTQELQGKAGNSYTLTIDYAGETYTATTAIRQPAVVDSLTYEFKESEGGLDEGYYLKFFGQELSGSGDFYHLRMYRNGNYQNKPEDLIFVSDQLVEGNYIHDLQINWKPYKANELIRAEMLSITEETYQFLLELSQQTNTGGMFPNPIANVRTNIQNVNAAGPKAVGHFGGAGLNAIEGVINPESNVIMR